MYSVCNNFEAIYNLKNPKLSIHKIPYLPCTHEYTSNNNHMCTYTPQKK